MQSRAKAWRIYEQSRGHSLSASGEEASPGELQPLASSPVAPNTHIRFDEDGFVVPQQPSSRGSEQRVRPRAQPRIARAQNDEAGPSASTFPDNLEDHVVEFDRASARPPPRARK